MKPATVIDWHRRGFLRYWRSCSRKPGRPRTPDEHIALIRSISRDQPTWGEDRIAEELAIKLGVKHSTSTIRKSESTVFLSLLGGFEDRVTLRT